MLLVVLGVLLLNSLVSTGRNSWHAEVSMKTLDCSEPRVCRFEGNRAHEVPDAVGNYYTAQINALGYRGPLPDVARSGDELRVFVFGDSIVFGLGVSDADTFSAHLQRILQERFPERTVTVANFGMPTTYLVSNLRSYRLFARAYSPDVVVLAEHTLSPNDMNQRIGEIRGSRVLQSLVKTRFGAEVVGRYQNARHRSFPRSETIADLRSEFDVLAADSVATGMKVVRFQFYTRDRSFRTSDYDRISATIPPELEVIEVSSGLTVEEYRESPWPIPGDGHPTADGQRHFAELLADALVPVLRVGDSEEAAPPSDGDGGD